MGRIKNSTTCIKRQWLTTTEFLIKKIIEIRSVHIFKDHANSIVITAIKIIAKYGIFLTLSEFIVSLQAKNCKIFPG